MPEQTKRCSRCRELRPYGEFRRRRKDGHKRMSECRQCHAELERNRRASKRSEADRQTVLHATRRLRAARTRTEAAAFVDQLIQQLGGPDAAAQKYHAMLDAAMRQNDVRSACRLLTGYLQAAATITAAEG